MKIYNKMKNLPFILLLICFINQALPQEFLVNNTINWDLFEETTNVENKISEIQKINDDLLIYLKSNNLLNRYLNNFHFLDYNFDGMTDIIYSGDAGTETKRTLIFTRTINNEYIKIFDKFGEVTNMYQNTEFSPYSLLLKENPCCGNNIIVFDVFNPLYSNNSISLCITTKYCLLIDSEMPSSFFSKPILFEVKNDLYSLRSAPIIDNDIFNDKLNITGNVVAEYTKGAKGYAISEKVDSSGRIWWFAIMINNNGSLRTIMDKGNNEGDYYYSLGWISSSFLQKLE